MLARRFTPAQCIAFPARSRVTWKKTGPSMLRGAFAIREDGSHPFEGEAMAPPASRDSAPGLAPDSMPRTS